MERIDIAGIAIDTEITGSRPAAPVPAWRRLCRAEPGFSRPPGARFRVIAPRHPGFGHTPRPAWFRSVHDIAYLYLDLLDRLDLNDTVLVGSSLGGWIALEMAVRSQNRIGRLVLIDTLGVKFGDREERDIADIYALPADEVLARTFADPARPVPDYAGSTTARRWRSRATARRPRSTAGSRTCTTRRSAIGCTGSPGPRWSLGREGRHRRALLWRASRRRAAERKFRDDRRRGALPADRTARRGRRRIERFASSN